MEDQVTTTIELVQEKNRFTQTLINIIPSILYIYDIVEHKNIFSNEGVERILGYSIEEVKTLGNQIMPFLMHPDDLTLYTEKILPLYARAQSDEKIVHQYRMKHKNGSWRWIESTEIIYERQVDGTPQQVFGIGLDITDRRQTEDELKRKNEELYLLNAEKDKFLAIISHDLRSPFRTFLGFTRMIVEDLPYLNKGEIQEIALKMRKYATNLSNLLENLLEWSRLQRGITLFSPESFFVMPMISGSLALYLEAFKSKKIDISYDISEDLMVYADENMLESITHNLASNALKFTSEGGKVVIHAKSTSNNLVEISIKDTGIGMNKEMLKNLFKLDIDSRRKGTNIEPGTGLGLIICKDLIEQQGGKIWVESTEGKGTTFFFTLPANLETEG